MEKLHLDVTTHRKWLRKLKQHDLVFPACVGGVGRVDLHLQLVDHKLRICSRAQPHSQTVGCLCVEVCVVCGAWCSGRSLTAGAGGEHGDGLEQHLVEEQSHGFVLQLVPQQEAVVDHVPALTGDGHALTTHKQSNQTTGPASSGSSH